MAAKLSNLMRFTTEYRNTEEIILRDHLAMERTKLANERTLLSYMRTSLYLVLGGLAFLGMRDFEDGRVFGYIALALSALTATVGIVRFFQLKRHLKTLYPPIVIAAGQATGNRTDEAFTTSNEHEKSPESH
jgi:putative membrane protein